MPSGCVPRRRRRSLLCAPMIVSSGSCVRSLVPAHLGGWDREQRLAAAFRGLDESEQSEITSEEKLVSRAVTAHPMFGWLLVVETHALLSGLGTSGPRSCAPTSRTVPPTFSCHVLQLKCVLLALPCAPALPPVRAFATCQIPCTCRAYNGHLHYSCQLDMLVQAAACHRHQLADLCYLLLVLRLRADHDAAAALAPCDVQGVDVRCPGRGG